LHRFELEEVIVCHDGFHLAEVIVVLPEDHAFICLLEPWCRDVEHHVANVT
jgi:hypothetical protein